MAFLGSWYALDSTGKSIFLLIMYPYNYFICGLSVRVVCIVPKYHTSNRRCILHGSHRTSLIGNTRGSHRSIPMWKALGPNPEAVMQTVHESAQRQWGQTPNFLFNT